tara:strand:+ start:600 stop:1175 length:576 start_codon:yes stop_codon:yes gene_type:complete
MNQCLSFENARSAWEHMSAISADNVIRNYSAVISMLDYLVTTDMFPLAVLDAYSTWNLEKKISDEQRLFFSEQRGGKQGDYREGMRHKIANVVDCLTHFPKSKRALITICNNSKPNHTSDDDAKCMREIHFWIDGASLHASVFFRAQAAQIFPKNIHCIGSLMQEVCNLLPQEIEPGSLYYHTTILVSDRS